MARFFEDFERDGERGMIRIFLISGKAQHGKDTVANLLKEKFERKSLIIHNADYLKYIAKQYMGWDGSKDESGRRLLQWLGTDKVRNELKKPLFWIEKTCDTIEILRDKFDYFFVPDTRFRNEIYYPVRDTQNITNMILKYIPKNIDIINKKLLKNYTKIGTVI